MKRAFSVASIAVVLGGGAVACGQVVGVTPPPQKVTPDASSSDTGPLDAGDEAAADAPDDALADDAAADAGDASDGYTPACVYDVDAQALAVIGSANFQGVQNIPAGVTPGATTILIQRGSNGSCVNNLALLIADDPSQSGVYQTQTVTPPVELDTGYEENVTIMADGLTIIGLNRENAANAADTTFLVAKRSAVGTKVFGPATAGPFTQIQAAVGTPQTLWAPVISVDGLEFFYTVHGDTSASVNGVYHSVRNSVSDPFPAGTRMPALIQNNAQYVSGITADRKTLYLEVTSEWSNEVFTRNSVADPFVNPNAPDPPTYGLIRQKPFGSCNQIVATWAPPTGGCLNEQVARTN